MWQTNPVIPYFIRRQYGNDRIFVADKVLANNIQKLTRRGTLDADDIVGLKALGFTFEQVVDPEAPKVG